MMVYGSALPFDVPARTFIIDGSIAHPVLPFIQALEKEKFKVVSGPGQSPIRLTFGKFWKGLVTTEVFPVDWLPGKFQRWDYTIDALIAVERDEHGNHALTLTSNGFPRRSNDFFFEVAATAADEYAKTGHLLHWTEFFRGNPKAMKVKGKTAQ